MAKLPKYASKFISKKIEIRRKEGYPEAQAVAIAFSDARKRYPELKRKLTRLT